MGVNDHVPQKKRKQKSYSESGGVGLRLDAEFVGYINLQLTDEQRAGFDTWVAGASAVDALEYHTSIGINFALRVDPKSGGYLASATMRDSSSPNAGLCVTARAREALTAFWRVVFCVVILSHHEHWTDLQPVANPDRW